MRRFFASGFRASFVLSLKWIPSQLNYSEKGSRFFGRDFDLAQTSDKDCWFPSLMEDVGEVDFTSHIHVPTVNVQSAPTEDPSSCTGHAAAVSSERLSVIGRNDCIGGFGEQMWRISLALTWCGLPLGSIGSQLLGASQMKWPAAGSGPEARHAQRVPRRSMRNVRVARFRATHPDAKPPSRLSPCQKSAVRCPPRVASCLENATVSKSLEKLAREVARVQGQPIGKVEGSETSDGNGPTPVLTSAQVVFGQRHHRLVE